MPRRNQTAMPLRQFVVLLLSVSMTGCNAPAPQPAEQQGSAASASDVVARTPLSLIVIDDDALATIAGREWQARSGQPLEVVTLNSQAVLERLRGGGQLRGDVIYFPGWLLGELCERNLLREIPVFVKQPSFAGGDLFMRQFFPLIRRRAMKWGELDMAIPSTERPLMLVYRADVLDYLELEPPHSWSELHELLLAVDAAQSETGSESPNPSYNHCPPFALAQPNDGPSAAYGFLARAVSYAQDRSRYSMLFDLATMRPQIDQPPFIRALDELRADARHADPSMRLDPIGAFEQLLRGQCAVAIGWLPSELPADIPSDIPIGFAPLPGSSARFSKQAGWEESASVRRVTLLGGNSRYLGVLRSTRRQRTAWNLAVRLGGREWGAIISRASVTSSPVRRSTIANIYPWVRGVGELACEEAWSTAMSMADSAFVPRIPYAAVYMDQLQVTIQRALSTQIPSAELLTQVAKSWQEVDVNNDTRRDAYYRSLGLEP